MEQNMIRLIHLFADSFVVKQTFLTLKFNVSSKLSYFWFLMLILRQVRLSTTISFLKGHISSKWVIPTSTFAFTKNIFKYRLDS